MTVRDVTPEWLATHEAYLWDAWFIGHRIVGIVHDSRGERHLMTAAGQLFSTGGRVGDDTVFVEIA